MTAPVRLRFAPGFNAAPLDGIGTADYTALEKTSGIRHGRHYGHSACLVAATAKRLAELPGVTPAKRGIICNGGPLALHAAWTMLNRARNAGPEFINPLQFPATLVSAAATNTASAIGAHAFAYVVGHNEFAFFEVVRRAAQTVRLGLADQVFAIGVIARDLSVDRVAARAEVNLRSDVGIGFCADLASPETGDLLLLGLGSHQEIVQTWPNASRYEGFLEGNQISCSWHPHYHDQSFLGATGAVVLHLAASKHKTLPLSIRNDVFIVSLQAANCNLAIAVYIHH